MLIDKTHVRWSLISAGVLLVSTGSYAVYAARAIPGPSGGSLMGLLYGVVGSLLMIFAGLLAVRRRLPTLRLGSAQFWLRGHLWLGTLSFVLILFHSGFHFGSTLETALMISFIVVVASGFYGLLLQQFIPRLMTSRVPLETFNQQVPFLCRRLQAESDVLVAEVCGKIECDHQSVGDAAYNLADAMGKLRNGKEGEDFQKFLDGIYADGSAGAQVKRVRVETAAAAGPAPTHAASVARSTPPTDAIDEEFPAASPPTAGKPMSKIEMARAAAAKKTAEQSGGEAADAPAEGAKPMSKIEMARAAAAKKKAEKSGSEASATPADAEKPMSKIELARAAAAKKKTEKMPGEAEAAPADAEKPMSKIEMARAAAAKMKAAQNGDDASDAPPAAKSPMSKVEMMRAAAAKKKGTQQTSPAAAPPVPATAVAAVATAPQPPAVAPIVAVRCPNCDKELVLPDASFLGRFARCPQCTQKFVLQLPVEEEPEPAHPEPPASPASELEQRVAVVESNGADGANDKPAKPLSKLELARAAAKKPAGAKSEKPPSKLELARAAAGKPAQGKPEKPAVAVKEPPAKPIARPAARGSSATEKIPRTEILKQFYLSNIRPFLADERPSGAALPGRVSAQTFGQMRSNLPAQLHPLLNRLQEFCDERRQFALQKRLHWLLHSWLLVHVPATVALFVLFIVHVVVALRVIPWPH